MIIIAKGIHSHWHIRLMFQTASLEVGNIFYSFDYIRNYSAIMSDACYIRN